MPPDPPRFGILCMPDRVLLTQLSCSLQCICAPPPFVNPGSVPVHYTDTHMHIDTNHVKDFISTLGDI